ncbi:MAG: IclR family transcriptional regulator [Firmicutes bacterium]|nr:IclR family transcriptional regulator [Bacillota bacterium]
MNSISKDQSIIVTSVSRALDILDLLGSSSKELGVTEISKAMGLPKTTVYRLLTTLMAHQYVNQDVDTGKYRLGLHLAKLGRQVLDHIDLRQAVRPFLKKLATLTGETVHLGILDNNQMIYIDKVESDQMLTMKSRIGASAPVHCTAVGKVLLAYASEKIIETILAQPLTGFTSTTITDPEALRRHLATIRERGYAIDDEEHEIGIRCIGVPVRNHARKVIAAISVAGPAVRITRERLEEIKPLVIEIGHEISHALGYSDLKCADGKEYLLKDWQVKKAMKGC